MLPPGRQRRDVQRYLQSGDQVEVQGALAVGDVVVKRGTGEIRNGARLPK